MDAATLYIFVDESGDFNFSLTGSEYFILTGVCTLAPLTEREGLAQIRYDLLSSGRDVECFHASDDKQDVRDRVFAAIKSYSDFEVHSVIAEKRKADPELYEGGILEVNSSERKNIKKPKVEEKFYSQICVTLLQFIIARFLEYRSENVTNVVVILDKIFQGKKHEFAKKQIGRHVSEKLGVMSHIYFHQTKSDINCQIADYCSWAIFVKWSRNEMRPFNKIKSHVKSELDLFKNSDTDYY
ncbi:MAG: DUF3800 domain-containing protein [Gammaproteobacteria bacterium AqS3]|nr:DUF3800 domain-containing protein [Gammaproteobacteria bacterium AqS3]